MANWNKAWKNAARIILLIAILSATAAVIHSFIFVSSGIGQILDFISLPEGETLVQRMDENKITFSLVDWQGIEKKNVSTKREQSTEFAGIADMAVDQTGMLYLIKDYYNKYTGVYLRQELLVYSLKSIFATQPRVFALQEEDGTRYRWLNITSSVILMGTSPSEHFLNRMVLDSDALLKKGQMTVKSRRVYPITEKEGIYQAVTLGTSVVYLSKSGKVFMTEENAVQAVEVYPARQLEELMYPIFLIPTGDNAVCIGERESGDILQLSVPEGEVQVQQKGSAPFSGVSSYTPLDIVAMSMADTQSFTAVVQNKATGAYEFLVSSAGDFTVISKTEKSVMQKLGYAFLLFLGYIAVISCLFGFGLVLVRAVRRSRHILVKLLFSAVPLQIIAFVLFGVFTYSSYSASIEQSFEKQVIDEGDMLTALFGIESFNEIEFPYDYTGNAYDYLKKEMGKRKTYTRISYYERGMLYSGVSSDLPCFYPYNVLMNRDAEQLNLRAATTGEAQVGIIEDRNGRRISCITPMGGSSGDIIYLLETGILTSNMQKFKQEYIQDYLLIAFLFILAVTLIMLALFMRILRPLKQIKEGMELFSQGNLSIRLRSESNDELSDISRVFNKLVNDIDIQLYNLKTISATYYRFVPQKIFRLLQKENLGELELGTNVQGKYDVLNVSMYIRQERMEFQQIQKLTNQFFKIVHSVANQFDATLVIDKVNLDGLKIICSSGESAIGIAMSAIAQIDGYNAPLTIYERLDVSFLLHRAEICYGICGDEERYVPALISQELDWISQNCERFRQLSSRLIVTSDAYGEIDINKYFHRFIGFLEDKGHENVGLYDFYDSSSPEIIRMLNDTRDMFNKAMGLYLQKRYYDAKNLFAVVLRENQYDNVSRHYIFKCEKFLQ